MIRPVIVKAARHADLYLIWEGATSASGFVFAGSGPDTFDLLISRATHVDPVHRKFDQALAHGCSRGGLYVGNMRWNGVGVSITNHPGYNEADARFLPRDRFAAYAQALMDREFTDAWRLTLSGVPS